MIPSLIIAVKKAKTGDAEAFSTLYSYYYKEMYKYSYYILRNNHDVEDVISETIIDAYIGIVGLRKEESFKFWLFKILLAKIKRRRKHYATRNTTEFDDAMEVVDLSDFALNAELMDALDKLSEEQRTIVVLSVLGGYTGKEIAYMLDRNSSTVRSILARSLKKLQNELT